MRPAPIVRRVASTRDLMRADSSAVSPKQRHVGRKMAIGGLVGAALGATYGLVKPINPDGISQGASTAVYGLGGLVSGAVVGLVVSLL